MVVLFLTFLDNTVVSVALGSVQGDLHAGVTALQWVVSAYALTFAVAMLAFGMVGDEFGRKRVMLAGAAVFCAGSVLCAMAPNAPVLIAGRAVMGLGAAASEPGTRCPCSAICTLTSGSGTGRWASGRRSAGSRWPWARPSAAC
jgi:MFS family permease